MSVFQYVCQLLSIKSVNVKTNTFVGKERREMCSYSDIQNASLHIQGGGTEKDNRVWRKV